MKNILIIGATSTIAKECAKIWASENKNIFLVGRDKSKLNFIENELKSIGSKEVSSLVMDINSFEEHKNMLDEAEKNLKSIDIVLIAHGTLTNQESAENNFAETLEEIKTNSLSVISLLTEISNRFIQTKNGIIAIISSVAGDRGRARNYIYGSAKAMVTTYASGLRQRLSKHNISVVTIKPGFVDTPMTINKNKNFLWSKPRTVALAIVKAIKNKKSEIYVPSYWRIIMLIIKLIPNFIFNKIKL